MPRARIACVLALMLAGLTSAAGRSGDVLFEDDFSRYPPGLLSAPLGQLNGAIQEYHYIAHRGVPLGPWANVINHLDAWAAGDEDGVPYLEQHTVNARAAEMTPLFITGDPAWEDYTVQARVRPLAHADLAGVVFRYRTNRHYYLFALTRGREARLLVRQPIDTAFHVAAWRELARADFPYETTKYYELQVESDGPAIRASIDGHVVIEASDDEIRRGKAGIAANIPARFQAFRVTAPAGVRDRIAARVRARDDELASLRLENPQPKLWKRFATPGYGAGRNVRFGDLDGDGRLDMLIAQNIPRVRGDAFDHISALTAVTLGGRVLWQSGRPDPRNGLLTNDTPFQIHDIDADGRNDVVLARDFKLQVLDGRTGAVKQWTWMPKMPAGIEKPPYALYSGDSIAFVNFSGDPGRREIVLKDRYRTFWVYSPSLELLFEGHGQTGHYPFPADIDGDGRDELFIGYAMWDHTGRQRWSNDEALKDHVDGLAVANMTANPDAPPRVYGSGSDEGLVVTALDGSILKHLRLGHTQSASIGRYRPDLPGLQYMTINYWRSPGIVTLVDADGEILAQRELVHMGAPLLPVNWRGDGQEFALLSGNVHEGGMIDGHLRRVVMFPDDGHPDLAAAVLNVTGDTRDEVILWDQQRVWIYTQDRPFTGDRLYVPERNPLYNDSNYRAVVSVPGWQEVESR